VDFPKWWMFHLEMVFTASTPRNAAEKKQQRIKVSRVGYLPSIEHSSRTPGDVFDPIMIGQGFSYIHTAFSTCMYLWRWILHRVLAYRFFTAWAKPTQPQSHDLVDS